MVMRAVYLCMVFAIASTPARAALIPLSQTTYDTATGLEWLDVNLTTGLTYAQAADAWSGWRFATGAEIDALAIRYIGSPEEQFTYGALLPTLAIIALLDPTFEREYSLDAPATLATLGFFDDGTGGRIGLAEFVVNFRNPFVGQPSFQGRWTTFEDFLAPNYASYQVGSFLVRSVPEPSTFALLTLGLGGLAFMRRRQRSTPVVRFERTMRLGEEVR